MQFTFGIITVDGSDNFLDDKVIPSIRSLDIPRENYEILVVGGSKPRGDVHIPFDENEKSGWITRKKNVVTENAKFENVVYTHDYTSFLPMWYQGYLTFGEDWDVCMNFIMNFHGTRYRDWVAWDDPNIPGKPFVMKEKIWCPEEGIPTNGGHAIVPIDYNKTQYMYVSGAYFVAKKSFMQKFPLNEELIQCGGEDIEWSYRIRNTFNYKMNPYSTVYLERYRPTIFPEINENYEIIARNS